MGRGRQKAKQQKIARKLKYLTTDTDYDELAKELSTQEPGEGSPDPFADIELRILMMRTPPWTMRRDPSLRMTLTSTPSGLPSCGEGDQWRNAGREGA